MSHDLRELTAGATGDPAGSDSTQTRAALRRQQGQTGWDEATLYVQDATQAYLDILGPRFKRQEGEPGRGSTFL